MHHANIVPFGIFLTLRSGATPRARAGLASEKNNLANAAAHAGGNRRTCDDLRHAA
jgi:hypothetical protein